MRRIDAGLVTPDEREELLLMLITLGQVNDAIRSFEDGEVNLRAALLLIATTISTQRAA